MALKPARDAGLLPSFPFGTDFTDVEQRLIPALLTVKNAAEHPAKLLQLAWQGFFAKPDNKTLEALARLQLDAPKSLSDRLYRALVSAALARGANI